MTIREIIKRLDDISHEPGRSSEDRDALQKAKSLLYLFFPGKRLDQEDV